MRVRSARHRDRSAPVSQPVAGLVGNGLVGLTQVELLVVTAALDHEARDDAVEHRVPVKTGVHVLEEMRDRERCRLAVEPQRERARRRRDLDKRYRRRHAFGDERLFRWRRRLLGRTGGGKRQQNEDGRKGLIHDLRKAPSVVKTGNITELIP